MAGSKRGPALFDLLDNEVVKGSKPLRVPGWWNRAEEPPPVGASVSESADAEPEPDPVPEAPSPPPAATIPFIELDGERVRVSFTSVTAAVAVFAALVVVLGAFELGRNVGDRAGFARGNAVGRRSYSAEALSEIEEARRQPPNTRVVKSLLVQPADAGQAGGAEAAATLSQPVQWIRDYTYVVAQEFPAGHEPDATRARAFLDRHGVATEAVRYPSGAIQLITVQGYNRNDPTQRRMADELLEKVRAAGADYFAQGGGYKLEGYFKTLKNDTW